MVERLIHLLRHLLIGDAVARACNNQSEMSVADACAVVCKRPTLTLYQPVAKVISAVPRAIFLG